MKPLPIAYIAPIKNTTSPPDCKLFPRAEVFQFLESGGNNGLPHHTQFSYASFSRFDLHYVYVAFGNIHFLLKLLPVQNVVFYLTFREEVLIRQGIRFHSYARHSSWRWLWCMHSPSHSRDRSRHSCYPLQVTLCPRSVFQFCSPEFQTHNTPQLPFRAPSVQTSRGKSQYVPLSMIRSPNGDSREA